MRLTITSFLLIVALSSNAQYLKPDEITVRVKGVLDSVFPGNKYPVWKKSEGRNGLVYEATFSYDETRTWAKIKADGTLILTEKDFVKDSLPQKSKDLIVDEYDFKSVYSCRKILINENVFYFVGISGTRLTYTLLFAEDGSLLESKNNLLKISLLSFASTLFADLFVY